MQLRIECLLQYQSFKCKINLSCWKDQSRLVWCWSNWWTSITILFISKRRLMVMVVDQESFPGSVSQEALYEHQKMKTKHILITSNNHKNELIYIYIYILWFSGVVTKLAVFLFSGHSTGDTNEVHGWPGQFNERDSEWYQDFEVLCLGKGFYGAGPGIQREGA